jgi:carbamoyl-phosphate synthase/aspartate carbamoyltransferase/dihydroorotase
LPKSRAEGLSIFISQLPVNFSEGELILKLPGLIDPHVHLREPGATHKEDFDTGTAAALAGGFTTVLAMPNTQPPLCDEESLAIAQNAAREKARCDYGIYVGAGEQNAELLPGLAPQSCGMKMYLDQTYGPLRLSGMLDMRAHVASWPKDRPLVAHSEGRSMAAIILLAALYDRSVHISHVSLREEILLIRKAKEAGLRVTCEVTPHHLFLTEKDLSHIGEGRGEVRPILATAEDRDGLWENMEVIDCFATDHAPHTLGEKEGDNPPPGFPGLETALGLLHTAVQEGRITVEQLVLRMHTNPKRIFGLPDQHETYVEIDPDQVWEVQAANMYSKSGWTPFEGMRIKGRVRHVTLHGQLAYREGEVVSLPGSGQDIAPAFRNT